MLFEAPLQQLETTPIDSSSFGSCLDQPSVQHLAIAFNRPFVKHQTQLTPGATEPFYQAAKSLDDVATIFSSHDYFSSALHEIAHWCIAGAERRQLDDYGYWYEPDGRSPEQQAEFFKVEVKPQALEWAFSLAAGIPFRLSIDNLDGGAEAFTQAYTFRDEVYRQLERYFLQGFPTRALSMIQLLCRLYRKQHPIHQPHIESCLL